MFGTPRVPSRASRRGAAVALTMAFIGLTVGVSAAPANADSGSVALASAGVGRIAPEIRYPEKCWVYPGIMVYCYP